jgi:hypothetical protein
MRCGSFRDCLRLYSVRRWSEADHAGRGDDERPSAAGLFLRFIAVCEILGALGLILPGLLRIRPGLTPLAAAGLVIIMIGAMVVTLATGPAMLALIPLVTGLLLSFVIRGRWRRDSV